MITIETITINSKEYRRTVSDIYRIRKVGTDEVYDEAIDVLESNWAYEEVLYETKGEEISDEEFVNMLEGVL